MIGLLQTGMCWNIASFGMFLLYCSSSDLAWQHFHRFLTQAVGFCRSSQNNFFVKSGSWVNVRPVGVRLVGCGAQANILQYKQLYWKQAFVTMWITWTWSNSVVSGQCLECQDHSEDISRVCEKMTDAVVAWWKQCVRQALLQADQYWTKEYLYAVTEIYLRLQSLPGIMR